MQPLTPSPAYAFAGPSRPLVILFLSILVSCGGRSTEDPPIPEPLYFEEVGSGLSGTLADTTEVVLRDSSAWDRLRSHLRPTRPFHSPDFEQTMVAVIALPQTSAGYQIRVESAERLDGSIEISYVVSAPGQTCIPILADTLPFQVVAIRRAEGAVRFRRRLEHESCSIE